VELILKMWGVTLEEIKYTPESRGEMLGKGYEAILEKGNTLLKEKEKGIWGQ